MVCFRMLSSRLISIGYWGYVWHIRHSLFCRWGAANPQGHRHRTSPAVRRFGKSALSGWIDAASDTPMSSAAFLFETSRRTGGQARTFLKDLFHVVAEILFKIVRLIVRIDIGIPGDRDDGFFIHGVHLENPLSKTEDHILYENYSAYGRPSAARSDPASSALG